MVRIWVLRNTAVYDPFYAARDAASQALAVEIARCAGLDYGLVEDEGYAEAFFTGEAEAALTALGDLERAGIEIYRIEVESKAEELSVKTHLGGPFVCKGGAIGGHLAEPGVDGKDARDVVGVVSSFAAGRRA